MSGPPNRGWPGGGRGRGRGRGAGGQQQHQQSQHQPQQQQHQQQQQNHQDQEHRQQDGQNYNYWRGGENYSRGSRRGGNFSNYNENGFTRRGNPRFRGQSSQGNGRSTVANNGNGFRYYNNRMNQVGILSSGTHNSEDFQMNYAHNPERESYVAGSSRQPVNPGNEPGQRVGAADSEGENSGDFQIRWGFLSPEEDARLRAELFAKEAKGGEENADSRKRPAIPSQADGRPYNVAAGACPVKYPRQGQGALGRDTAENIVVMFKEPVPYMLMYHKPAEARILIRKQIDWDEGEGMDENPPAFLRLTKMTRMIDLNQVELDAPTSVVRLMDTVLVWGYDIRKTGKQEIGDIGVDIVIDNVFNKAMGYNLKPGVKLACAHAITKSSEAVTQWVPAIVRVLNRNGKERVAYFVAPNAPGEQEVLESKFCETQSERIVNRSLAELLLIQVPEGWTKLRPWMAVPSRLVTELPEPIQQLSSNIRPMHMVDCSWYQGGMPINGEASAQRAVQMWITRTLAQHAIVLRGFDLCYSKATLVEFPEALLLQISHLFELEQVPNDSETYLSRLEHFKIGEEILIKRWINPQPVAVKAHVRYLKYSDSGGLIAVGVKMEGDDHKRFYEEIVSRQDYDVSIDLRARTGLEQQIKALRAADITLSDENKRVVRSFCSLYLAEGDVKALGEAKAPNKNEQQRKAMALMNQEEKGHPLIKLQAGFGTGKTETLTASALYGARKLVNGELIILAATTNLATMNFLDKIVESGQLNTVLYLQSMVAEVELAELTNAKPWGAARTPERLKQLLQENALGNLSTDEMNFAHRYAEKRGKHDGESLQEKRAIGLLLRTGRFKMVITTTTLLLHMADVLKARTCKMYVDEAGLVSGAELLALAATFSHVEQILIAGDVNQMAPYIPKTCDWLNALCGTDSALQRACERKDVSLIELTTTYRSHPKLTEVLSEAFYGNKLKSGLTDADRSGMTDIIQLPVEGIPLVMIHVEEGKESTVGLSLRNTAQEKLAARLVKTILTADKSKTITVAVLCFYKATVAGVVQELNSKDIHAVAVNVNPDLPCNRGGRRVEVSTVDAFQGRQDQVVIVVTSRTTAARGEYQDDGSHVGQAGRVVVACTRAKDGMIVIGNQRYLATLMNFMKLQQAAGKRVPLVDERYVEALEKQMAPTRTGGIWVDEAGRPAFTAKFQVKQKWLLVQQEHASPPPLGRMRLSEENEGMEIDSGSENGTVSTQAEGLRAGDPEVGKPGAGEPETQDSEGMNLKEESEPPTTGEEPNNAGGSELPPRRSGRRNAAKK